jgi:ApaG protein
VRFSLLSLEEQAAAGIAPPILSVQLLARHWVITDSFGRSEEVHGGGVIGEYPRLLPGSPAHAYQSQTPMRRGATRGGSMHGSFSFVHGTIAARTGPEFDARCAPFSLDVPEYAF